MFDLTVKRFELLLHQCYCEGQQGFGTILVCGSRIF